MTESSFTFYLGTHEPSWLERIDVPLFVSVRRLRKRKSDQLRRRLPTPVGRWALDSGGFSEIDQYGQWETTPDQYVAEVARIREEMPGLDWVAPQDWMCEPHMLAKTGLSIADHQGLTIRSVQDLRQQLGDLVIPVLQGWTLDDYLRHRDAYDWAGFDLEAERIVGVGSVCRREKTGQAEQIVWSLYPIRLHGFGMKTTGLRRYGAGLASADSMAWSYQARKREPMPGHSHKSCANCPDYALAWRDRVLAPPARPTLFAA